MLNRHIRTMANPTAGPLLRMMAASCLLSALAACSSIDSMMPGVAPASGTQVTTSHPRFADSDPHEWEGGAPWLYAVHGTDVSKYQNSVDWHQAKASGISFAFIKATEGGDRVDDLFDEHWRKSRAAGVPRAAYHFYYFCRPAAEQARWFIDNVPKEKRALPPVLDMEWNPQSPTCKLRPDPATVRSEMRIFLSMVEKHYGKKPIIYTSVDFFDDNSLAAFNGYPYWLRSVAGHPDDKYSRPSLHLLAVYRHRRRSRHQGRRRHQRLQRRMRAWKKWLKANAA